MDRERAAAVCGLLAPSVALVSMLLATIVASPETFTWRDRALSHMGEAGTETFLVFNGGLILAGLVGLPFGWLLWREARNHLERAGVVILAIAVVGLVGVGVFFIGHDQYYLPVDLHAPAAGAVFIGAPIAAWVYGSGLALAGDVRLAVVSFWLGIAHPMTWLVWILAIAGQDGMPWFAVTEFVVAAVFAAWIALLALVALEVEPATRLT